MSDMKWGDVDENEKQNDDEFTRTVDQKTGIITETYVREDADGKRFRVTKKYRETKKAVRVNKNVEARKRWAKFGDCNGLPPGPETNITSQIVDLVELNLNQKEEKKKEEEPVLPIGATVCRRCGKTGHWTLRCPNFSSESAADLDRPTIRQRAPLGGGNSNELSTGRPGRYVAPRGRGGDDRGGSSEAEPTLRVSNLPYDTTDDDLRELFRVFGRTTRCFLAKNKHTGECRGFAFVTYCSRNDAQAAIDAVHDRGYGDMILHVEWAKPREPSHHNTNTQAIQAAQRRRF
jgi:translation initiation factor 3 subunit G